MSTEAECIQAAGAVLADSDAACAQMTAREQAEAAWHPGSRKSVDELEDQIRADRGMPAVNRSTPDARAS